MTNSHDPNRWRRRARTVPAMLAMTAGALLAAPLALPLTAVLDLVRGRRRLPGVRAGLFGLRYLVNDSAEIIVAPLLWIGARRPTGSSAGLARYRCVQTWSVRSLAAAADGWIGVRLDPSAQVPVEPGQGPLIVLVRHVSMLDASVPSLLLGLDSPWQIRSIVTDDVLADPGFDLIYQPLGTVFIDRDEGASARRIIAGFSEHDGPDDVVTIYPEGRLFRPSVLARSLERLAERSPERAERLAGLRHVLPPRPGGTLALLDALPTADVLLVGHVGFEPVASISDMARTAPIDTEVRILVRRIPRSSVPTADADRVAWLDALWLDLDDWLDTCLPASHG